MAVLSRFIVEILFQHKCAPVFVWIRLTPAHKQRAHTRAHTQHTHSVVCKLCRYCRRYFVTCAQNCFEQYKRPTRCTTLRAHRSTGAPPYRRTTHPTGEPPYGRTTHPYRRTTLRAHHPSGAPPYRRNFHFINTGFD